ncbi:MAG: YbbR-like domain-containing protein [bacterium]
MQSLALLFISTFWQPPVMRFAILENYKVKLTALVVASLFWFAVVTESNYQYDMDVSIRPINTPKERIIVNEITPTARVRFEGNGKSLLALRFNDEAILEMNLEDINADAHIPLNKSMLRIPRRSRKVIDWHVLSPDTVFVKIAFQDKKKVPIIPQIDVETAPAFTIVGKIQLSPDSVLITGPIQQIRTIERIYTEPMEFKNRKKNIRGRAKLIPPVDSLKISVASKDATFFVDVQKLLERSFVEIPVTITNVPRNMKITPRPSTVSLTANGGEDYLMQFSEEDFLVSIDYNQKSDEHAQGYTPTIKMPANIIKTEIVPAYIKLEIERRSK